MQAYAAVAKYPALTVPMGYKTSGEPIGLTFIGKPFTEALTYYFWEVVLKSATLKFEKFLKLINENYSSIGCIASYLESSLSINSFGPNCIFSSILPQNSYHPQDLCSGQCRVFGHFSPALHRCQLAHWEAISPGGLTTMGSLRRKSSS